MENRIINTSQSLFLRLGIRSVSMEDIAKELGISKKTIYIYFKDKTHLVDSVIEHSLNLEIKRSEEIIKIAKNPIDEVLTSTEMMRDLFSNINPILFYDLEKYYPETWNKYLELRKYFAASTKRNLTEGIEQKLYREDIDSELFSKIRMAMVDMVFDMTIFNYKTDNIYNIMVQSTDLFLRGIFTPLGLSKYLNTKNV